MSLKIGDVYRNVKNQVMDNYIVQQTFHSPINTAILIVLVILLIVAFYFRDYEGDDKYSNLIKIGVYGALTTVVLLFMHNIMIKRIEQKRGISEDEKLIFKTNNTPNLMPIKLGANEKYDLDEVSRLLNATASSDSSESSQVKDKLTPSKKIDINDLL